MNAIVAPAPSAKPLLQSATHAMVLVAGTTHWIPVLKRDVADLARAVGGWDRLEIALSGTFPRTALVKVRTA